MFGCAAVLRGPWAVSLVKLYELQIIFMCDGQTLPLLDFAFLMTSTATVIKKVTGQLLWIIHDKVQL